MRVAVEVVRVAARRRRRARRRRCAAGRAVRAQRLGELGAGGAHRGEVRGRALRDEPDAPPAHLPGEHPLRRGEQVERRRARLLQPGRPGDGGVAGQQAEQGVRQHRLAAAGLADQREALAPARRWNAASVTACTVASGRWKRTVSPATRSRAACAVAAAPPAVAVPVVVDCRSGRRAHRFSSDRRRGLVRSRQCWASTAIASVGTRMNRPGNSARPPGPGEQRPLAVVDHVAEGGEVRRQAEAEED